MRILDEPFQLIVEAGIRFTVYDESETFVKGHLCIVLRIFNLVHIRFSHDRQPHFLEFTDSIILHDVHPRNKQRLLRRQQNLH